MNFAPLTQESKAGAFTRFVHEPHFGAVDQRGCSTCHALGKERAYLKSYEQANAESFQSNFEDVKIETCRSCHAEAKARQDCLTCHNYHVTPVTARRLDTKTR